MDEVLSSAKTGLDARHKGIMIISNNVANANTNSFKKNQPQYADLAYQTIVQPGSATSSATNAGAGVMVGTGTRLVDNKKVFTDGSQIQTGNSLDLAISGRGFFKVQMPNSSEYAYTRDGSLQLNSQGQITLANGYLVQPAMTIPTGTQKITISTDGIISGIDSTGASQQIGQIELTDFINPAGLEPIGNNLYLETTSSGIPTAGTPATNGLGQLSQGALEASNVNIVEEMVKLIEEQRLFELETKIVSADEQMQKKLIDET